MLLINCKRGLLPRSPLRVQLFQRIIHEMNQSRKEALESRDAPGALQKPPACQGRGTNPALSGSASHQCREARSSHRGWPWPPAPEQLMTCPSLATSVAASTLKHLASPLVRTGSPPTSSEASTLLWSVSEAFQRGGNRRRAESVYAACRAVPENVRHEPHSPRAGTRSTHGSGMGTGAGPVVHSSRTSDGAAPVVPRNPGQRDGRRRGLGDGQAGLVRGH